MTRQLAFSADGPFDDEERAVIRDVCTAVEQSACDSAPQLLAEIERSIRQLDRIGEVLASYPSLFKEQILGRRRRDLSSFVDLLRRSTPSNFDMFLPTRALVSRTLVMGEVNFYRLLRFVCDEALAETPAPELRARVDRRLCHSLYARLAEAVMINIASDGTVGRNLRDKAVLSLSQLWEAATYRVSDFFPVLEATWEARRRVPATLGTLIGTAEMFQLIQHGCDAAFVDYLVRPEQSEDEVAAFREFLFGATTEQLKRIEAQMVADGRAAIGADEVADNESLHDAYVIGGDPALALFEFFLWRHLQARARRQADLPGPKRTAEEYVMLNYLEQACDAARLSVPGRRR